VQTFPIVHLDKSEQGIKIKEDLQRYGADVRFVENSACGGTTLLRCTHKRDNATGERVTTFRATSPGSQFPKRKYLRARDEAPNLLQRLNFIPDIFFFDAAEAGLRYLASELRKKGTLVYFEPESDADQKKFFKAVEVSDIVKFSHEKVKDLSFVDRYTNKLYIRTLGAEGLEFNLCGQGWVKISSPHNHNVVDTEGAGDWTTSQFIADICEKDILSISKMTVENLTPCLTHACKTASHSVSYLGSKGMIVDGMYV
jgi:sugar/nucleoside kinase (ribokinase family)